MKITEMEMLDNYSHARMKLEEAFQLLALAIKEPANYLIDWKQSKKDLNEYLNYLIAHQRYEAIKVHHSIQYTSEGFYIFGHDQFFNNLDDVSSYLNMLAFS